MSKIYTSAGPADRQDPLLELSHIEKAESSRLSSSCQARILQPRRLWSKDRIIKAILDDAEAESGKPVDSRHHRADLRQHRHRP